MARTKSYRDLGLQYNRIVSSDRITDRRRHIAGNAALRYMSNIMSTPLYERNLQSSDGRHMTQQYSRRTYMGLSTG